MSLEGEGATSKGMGEGQGGGRGFKGVGFFGLVLCGFLPGPLVLRMISFIVLSTHPTPFAALMKCAV